MNGLRERESFSPVKREVRRRNNMAHLARLYPSAPLLLLASLCSCHGLWKPLGNLRKTLETLETTPSHAVGNAIRLERELRQGKNRKKFF